MGIRAGGGRVARERGRGFADVGRPRAFEEVVADGPASYS